MQPSRAAYRVSPKLSLRASLGLAKNPRIFSDLEIDINIG